MQLTDIEEVMRSKEQEVAVLQQAIEQLVQEGRQRIERWWQTVASQSMKFLIAKSGGSYSSRNLQPRHCGLQRLEVESITAKMISAGNEVVIPLGSQQGNCGINHSNWQELPLQCYADFVSAGAVWSQWWILPRADMSKITVIIRILRMIQSNIRNSIPGMYRESSYT